MSVKSWSDDQTQELIRIYEQETKDIEYISNHFDRKPRSVISKLVQLKIYEKEDKNANKSKRTVKTMLRDLENILSIEIEGTNLNKKSNLTRVVEAIEKLSNSHSEG